MLICSKYFIEEQDFINLMCVNSKFKDITEKLRFNPISITSLKLFPKIQTQYLYHKSDSKIEGIDKYETWFKVSYDQFLKYKEININCHHVNFTLENKKTYGSIIPSSANALNKNCFCSTFDTTKVIIPNSITSIGNECFEASGILECVLSNTLTKISKQCFNICTSLTAINISSTIKSLDFCCFCYCQSIKTINLPNSITSIKSYCFSSCKSLQSIILPTSLEILNDNMFSSCSSLSNILLPTTLKIIGNECFKNCLNLQAIEIPNSIKSIGIDCFYKCKSLTNLQFQYTSNNFFFKVSYNDSLFYKQFNVNCPYVILTENDVDDGLDVMKQTNSNDFIIPNSIIEIDNNAFDYKNDIKSITIPSTVTSIGDNCFQDCSSLTFLSIHNNIKSIGMNCFKGSNKLKELVLPLNYNNKYPFKVSYRDYLILKQCNIDCENVSFGYYDYMCNSFKIVEEIPIVINMDIGYTTSEKTIKSNIISLKRNHLSRNITSIIIPTYVTHLHNDCFKNYTMLQSITIPTTIKYIGKHLIDGCTSLINLNYDGDWNDIIVSYTDHIQYKSKGLVFNNIEFTKEDKKKYGNVVPSIVHSLNQTYYNRADDLFHIPTHITYLGSHMFAPSWLDINEKNVFYEYSNLKSIKIPSSVQTIPKYCFSKCYLLTNVVLPTTLCLIKKKAFSNCISLQSIIIPSSVVLIEKIHLNTVIHLRMLFFKYYYQHLVRNVLKDVIN